MSCLQTASSIDWISDTLFQGYTDLQSLIKSLDHRGIASDTVYSQARLPADSLQPAVVSRKEISPPKRLMRRKVLYWVAESSGTNRTTQLALLPAQA